MPTLFVIVIMLVCYFPALIQCSCPVPKPADHHVRMIGRRIRAVDWERRDEWIHHDPYNIIDAFGLTFEEVMEARDETMQKFNLKQI